MILGVLGSAIAKRWLEVGWGGPAVVRNEMAAEEVAHSPSRATDTMAREATHREYCRRVGARPAAIRAGVGWYSQSEDDNSDGGVG